MNLSNTISWFWKARFRTISALLGSYKAYIMPIWAKSLTFNQASQLRLEIRVIGSICHRIYVIPLQVKIMFSPCLGLIRLETRLIGSNCKLCNSTPGSWEPCFFPFGPYTALIRPSKANQGRKFGVLSNFSIKTRNKVNS